MANYYSLFQKELDDLDYIRFHPLAYEAVVCSPTFKLFGMTKEQILEARALWLKAGNNI